MKKITFLTGGCRSGKSRYALELAEKIGGRQQIFIATCMPFDEEMKQRVARHQMVRGKKWITLEVPIELPEAIRENGSPGKVVLVDCLTLWISNLLMQAPGTAEDEIIGSIDELEQSLQTVQCPVFLVSNEVGTGIVPENPLARKFRDIIGLANQRVAAWADEVIWMVAGIPVTLK